MNVRTVEQEIINRAVDGIDYGRRVRVLARSGERMLLWVPGQPVWAGTGQAWAYSSAHMMLHLGNGRYNRLCDGGRLSARRIAELAAPIDAAFGEGFAKLIEIKATVIVGEGQ